MGFEQGGCFPIPMRKLKIYGCVEMCSGKCVATLVWIKMVVATKSFPGYYSGFNGSEDLGREEVLQEKHSKIVV